MCLAIPGRVMEIEGDDPLVRSARVAFGGALKRISLGLLPEARVGDHVLVHAGFAISVVDDAEARRIESQLDALDAFGAEGTP